MVSVRPLDPFPHSAPTRGAARPHPLGLFFVLALWLAAPALAQPDPMRWGKIPDEHLQMTAYAEDPDAQALILGDFGEADVSNSWDVTYDRHRRVKLFGEAAYDLATVSITYYAGRDGQHVRGVKGQTFVPQPDGKAKRVKLSKRNIFEENLEGDRKRITFTLPALEPGAVFEYRYTIESESPVSMPRWYFQDEEPVLHSEFRLTYPQDLAYTIVTQGNPEFSETTEEEGVRSGGKTNLYRWVAADVPALREEQYMTTLEDHVQKLDVQLVEYYRPGIGAVSFFKTWDQVAEELGDSQGFGRALRAGRDVRRQADALTAGLTGAEAKARAVYDFVRSSAVWDGAYRVYADRRLDEVLDVKRGTSAEINLLLVALLREAGVKAEPALVSTRTHGRIIRQYPLLSQFNHVVAAARVGGRWTMLDATDAFRPFGLLPFDVLGGVAWLTDGSGAWLPLEGERSEHRMTLDAALHDDGSVSGTLRSERSGYAGLRARHRIQEEGAEGFVASHVVDDLAGVEVGSVTISGMDEHDAPLVAEVEFTVPAYAQDVGDLMLLNPLLIGRTEENPFTLRRRTYPVDFGYPSITTYEASIALHDGVEVDEMPEIALLFLPVRGGGYERSVKIEESVLRVEARSQVNRPVFEPHHYADLKTAFDRYVAADEEVVVLRRVVAPEASAAPAETVPPTGEEDEVSENGPATGEEEQQDDEQNNE